MLNSLLVTIPTVLLALLLSSVAAFALSRYDIPFRRTIILVMLAGNLLPPQILLVPVAKLAELLGIYDTLTALIVVQVGFGLGFYTFVLQGFMRSIPGEIQQAALIDGAGVAQIFWRIILPMTRPALAALGALAFTWMFNDLLWSITVLRTGTVMPVTPALLGLQGQYVSNWNVIAAGSVIAAVPTVAVFLRFQKHFISGLGDRGDQVTWTCVHEVHFVHRGAGPHSALGGAASPGVRTGSRTGRRCSRTRARCTSSPRPTRRRSSTPRWACARSPARTSRCAAVRGGGSTPRLPATDLRGWPSSTS